MARPLRITYPGAFYHVTSRGNERKDIFKSRRDREKFLEYFESAAKRYDAVIHVFCLMDTHYHLLLKTPSGNLPQIMRHVNGAYTTYFNVKRGRSGHLFQGRYKAILVDIDEYAKELSRYIHLNPVRAKIVNKKYDNPLDEVVSSTLLGSPDFIAFIKDKFLSYKKPDKNLLALKELIDKVSLKDIFDEVESVFGKKPLQMGNALKKCKVLLKDAQF